MQIKIQRSRDFPRCYRFVEEDWDGSMVVLADGLAEFPQAREQAIGEAARRGLQVINEVSDLIRSHSPSSPMER